jgi:hypothetical protein
MLDTSLKVSYALTDFKVSFQVNKTLQGTNGLPRPGLKPHESRGKPKHGKIFPTESDISELLQTHKKETSIDYLVIHFTPLNPTLRHFNAAPGTPTLPEICLTVTGEISEYL